MVRHRNEESCEDPGKRLKSEIEFVLSTVPNSKMDMKDLSIQESVHRYKRGLNQSLYSFIDENEESFSLTRENDKSFVELKNQEVRVCRVVSVEERKTEDYLASLKTVLEEDNKLVVKAQPRDS